MLSQSYTNPLVVALKEHQVSAAVADFDHYRVHGGLSVDTDYIISVQRKEAPKDGEEGFEGYRISKTYSAFRSLASQLQKIAKSVTKKKDSWDSLSSAEKNIVKLSESVLVLVDSQKTEYLGKVNFTYVKSMAKQRSQVLNDILDLLVEKFPEKIKGENINVGYMAGAIETFFLTDFCVEEDEETEATTTGTVEKSGSKKKLLGGLTPSKLKRSRSKQNSDSIPNLNLVTESSSPKRSTDVDTKTPKKKVSIQEPASNMASPVVPKTRKMRRSVVMREQDVEFFTKEGGTANLLMEDSTPSTSDSSKPVTASKSGGSKLVFLVENNPFVFFAISAAAVFALRFAAESTITMDTDVALLVGFSFFCLGFHMPRPQGIAEKPAPAQAKKSVSSSLTRTPATRASMLLRKSMSRRSMIVSPKASLEPGVSQKRGSLLEMLEEVEAEVEEGEEDPLIMSPLPIYPKGAALGEHHNCYSEPDFDTFKVRGPNYLSNKKKVPSGPFVFPVRGVDLFLTDLCPENVGTISGIMGGNLGDVPTFIVNFRLPWGVLLFYSEIPEKLLPFLYKCYDPAFDASTLPSLDSLAPGERTAARWLMGDDEYKSSRLKIVPVVQKGPWIVKSVVGGKPAIIGTKLPVSYIYQPPRDKKAAYLEADLDIVSSSAARGILSVTSSAAVDLTIDLGFVVEGREKDELPEQMLTGARLHGIDPLNAPPLPPSKDMFDFGKETMSTTDEDDEDD